MTVCHVCGIPADAGFFDESRISPVPAEVGDEVVLVRYELHQSYCGMLVYFAQYTNAYARDPSRVETPDLQWEIRINGYPRDPYLAFNRIINPWGLHGFPMNLRLEEGSLLEFVVRRIDPPTTAAAATVGRPVGAGSGTGRLRVAHVGGRLVGRYWYNTIYGGAPNPL